ncbi:disease resistance protein PIK6-NP-like [Hordeum vulgare subsp. vulgare]|uniref:disease resistance protein PIK6-NP-like n=1 Tax=Hordeum vulgare subsp. vulgare TaxID=112509 RepID=UPI001D1A3E43|nr:disease resistance protein PIK6-NP-like [Hordeum vulgare subsp. vulgare]
MAEFALGLTKTAVEGTLIRVKTAIEEEAKLKVRVQNDLVFITCEFEMMQSFLNVTNAAERVKNELVRTWVRQLRDLAFDVEDCVEFVIHLDINKSSLLWRVVPSCMAPVLPLDEAVAEIKQLKARVEDLSQRNLRYNLITNNTSKISEQQQPATTAAESSTAFHILNEVWEAAGRRCGGIADLQKLITSEGNDLQVVSLWSGGSGSTSSDGTTSIIRKAYGDPEICKEFKSHAWVKLNHGLFNPQDFIRSLLFQFYGMKAAVHTEYHGMEAELIQQVKKQKYLVIVEQVSTTVEWDAIRMYLPDCKNGSRIVISTKQLGLATLCTGEPYKVSDLRRFTDDQHICAIFKKGCERRNSMGELNWQLRCRGTISVWGEGRGKSVLMDRVYKGIRSKSKEFKEIAHGGSNGMQQFDDEMMKRTIAKCGGLPKVIAAIGESTTSDLEGFSNDFMHILETSPEFHTLKGLFSWMHSYFDDCSDSVKPCIFYLAVFPADYNVRKRRLLRRWIAEGYSRDASADITAEENGERLFSELMELSVIQQESPIISTKLISTRQVNGFFREYIISRPMEDNLVFALEGHCSLNSHRTGQHLTIGNSWDRDEAVFKSMDLSRLRSLTVFGEWRSFLISSSGSNMRLLRALDLEDTTNLTDDDLYKIGKLPPRLKFLSLRRCIHITFLPDSVGKLRQLQTLDVRGTSIVTMPESIINLHKLQYIRAGITVDSEASTPPHVSSWLPDVCRRHRLVGVQVPEEIGKLTALHTLGVINVAASGAKAFLPELKKLTQLRKLGVSGINKHNSKHFFAAISYHGHFESLSVRLNKDNNNQGCCLDGIPLPLKNLRSLKLHGLNEKLPDWGSDQLSKLIKLDLEMATLMESDIEFLGKLPQLCILRIRQLQDPELHFRALVNGEEHDCYEKVKVLEIACSSSSSSFQVTFGCKAMKNLELFKVNCPSVSSFQFSGLEHLSQLTEFLRN